MEFEILADKPAIELFAMQLLGHQTFPPFLFMDDKYKKLVVGMYTHSYPIGMAYGVVDYGANTFFLHFVYVKKVYRSHARVKSLIDFILSTARKHKNICKSVWKYIANDVDVETNAHAKLITSLKYCAIKETKCSIQYRIKTENFSHLRGFKIFKPTLWKQKGYGILRLADCNDSLLNILRNNEDSPFDSQDKHSLTIDDYNSFVFTKNSHEEPVGWIVCNSMASSEITIHHFFMYKSERANVIAHSFAAHVLNIIATSFDYLLFDVTRGNRQMEMVVKRYFLPIIEKSSLSCSLCMDFVEM